MLIMYLNLKFPALSAYIEDVFRACAYAVYSLFSNCNCKRGNVGGEEDEMFPL